MRHHMQCRQRRSGHGRSLGLLGVMMLFFVGMVDLGSITTATGVIISTMMIPHVNPPPKGVLDKRVRAAPVAFFVQVKWVDGDPHDIDTWIVCDNAVRGYRDNLLVVSYEQPSSEWLDLLRDDQGLPSVLNHEVVQSNSEVERVPANAYCRVNVHLYHSHGGTFPVSGTLLAISNKDSDIAERHIATVPFTIRYPGEEITIFSVAWDSQGKVLSDSVQTWPKIKTVKVATRRRQGGP